MADRLPDRGARRCIIFVAVVHRYAAGLADPGVQDWLLSINLSWAQELCIYMFIWMAKFGAAYGVRTGIHVGVDVLINRLPDSLRRKYVLFGLLSGALFTVIVGTLGANYVWAIGHTDQVSADLELAAVDRLPLHSAGLVPDVLPLPAGRLGVLARPASCRTTITARSKGIETSPTTSIRTA